MAPCALPPCPQEFQPAAAAEPQVRYERFARRDAGVSGFVYRPSGQLGSCAASRLRRLLRSDTLPPEIRVEEVEEEGSGRGDAAMADAAADPTPDGGAAPGLHSDDGGSSSQVSGGGGGSDADGWAGTAEMEVPAERPEGGERSAAILDMFCGAGGLSLGLQHAMPGAAAKWACDLFSAALRTYEGGHAGELRWGACTPRLAGMPYGGWLWVAGMHSWWLCAG